MLVFERVLVASVGSKQVYPWGITGGEIRVAPIWVKEVYS